MSHSNKVSHQVFSSLDFRSGVPVSPNRLAMAPLTNGQSPGGVLSTAEAAWLRRRMQGGYGMIVSAAALVETSGAVWNGQIGVATPEQAVALGAFGEECKKQGKLFLPQVFHGGFRAQPQLTGGELLSASSFDLGAATSRAMTNAEVHRIADAYASSAKRVVEAGCAGVEIHGANGYLITQFLSSETNTRSDEWGGTLERRMQFLLEVVRRCKKQLPSYAVLGLRLSPEYFGAKTPFGVPPSPNTLTIPLSETLEVIGELQRHVVLDYLHLSMREAWAAPMDPKMSSTKPLVAWVREVLDRRTKLMVAGGIRSAEHVGRVLDAGADCVALGSAAILDPDLPLRWQKQGDLCEWQVSPRSPQELMSLDISPSFIEYLKRFPQGYVR